MSDFEWGKGSSRGSGGRCLNARRKLERGGCQVPRDPGEMDGGCNGEASETDGVH